MLIAGILSSCTGGTWPDTDPRTALTEFSNRVAQAEHVLVTKPAEGGTPTSLTLSGADAHAIVKAASSSKLCGDILPNEKALRVVFFKGTNLLGTLATWEGRLWPQRTNQDYLFEYEDSTGTLSNLMKIPPERWH